MTRQPDADVREALEDLTDMIGNINPDCCNSGFPIGAARRCLATITAALQQTEARAVAAEVDARRYRWLRLADTTGPRTMQMQYHHVEHLDAAIDAAQEANP